MLLPDWEIKLLAEAGMIDPFVDSKTSSVNGERVISFGTGSYGYDMRVANEWRSIKPIGALWNEHAQRMNVLDPKNMPPDSIWTDTIGDYYDIPAHGFVLARSVERFDIPPNVHCICLGKSTYARLGVILNITPLEAGWAGHVTIEISNTAPLPARIYANEGIAQVMFFRSKQCQNPYGNGKYQAQGAEIVGAKV
jgi:dCTP deaminase